MIVGELAGELTPFSTLIPDNFVYNNTSRYKTYGPRDVIKQDKLSLCIEISLGEMILSEK